MDLDALADRLIVPSFSALGFRARSRSFEPIPRMDGTTVVLTGPTSGIGAAAAKRFDDLGASLVLVGRSAEKLDRLTDGLSGDHRTIVADLSLLDDARSVVDQLDPASIDVVVHNAGAMFDRHARTADGIERTLALNLVIPVFITDELLGRGLPETSRVVFVSSGGMYTTGPSLRDQRTEEGYRPALAYARAKRGQVVAVEAWAAAHPDGPVFAAMHPGWVDTPGVESSLPTFRTITKPVLRTPDEGADTIVWLAAADDVPTGGFWLDRRRRPTHYRSATRSEPERLERFLAEVRDLATTVNR
jgi:NAD(P)-dependent dehydrogenase (short-subunit alcohol dehydrogenase family)